MAKGKGYRVNMAKPRRALIKRAERAFALVNDTSLPESFDSEMLTDKWAWPGETLRRSGVVAGSPRDIRDTGELIDSYQREQIGRRTFVHRWTAPHALLVHNGATLSNGTAVPPRPWTDAGVQKLPSMFAQAFKQLG